MSITVSEYPTIGKYIRGEDYYARIAEDIFEDELNDLDFRLSSGIVGSNGKTSFEDYSSGYSCIGLEFKKDTYSERYIPVLTYNRTPFRVYRPEDVLERPLLSRGFDNTEIKAEKDVYEEEDNDEDNDEVKRGRMVCLCGRYIGRYFCVYDMKDDLFLLVGSECICRHYDNVQKPSKRHPCSTKGCEKSRRTENGMDLCGECFREYQEKCREQKKKEECFLRSRSRSDCFAPLEEQEASGICPLCKIRQVGINKYTGKRYKYCFTCNEKDKTKKCIICSRPISSIYSVCYTCKKGH